MSDYTVGRVNVGLKRVEIRAVTAPTFIRPTGDGPRPHIVVRHPQLGDQLVSIGNAVHEVGFQDGDRATVFWCARGNKESNWAAGYNHRTGAFGVSNFGINELILLPAHNFLGILAIFVGVFSFAAGPGAVIVILPLCIGFFAYVRKRNKKVRRAIETALEEIKRQESGQPAAVAQADLDMRLKTT